MSPRATLRPTGTDFAARSRSRSRAASTAASSIATLTFLTLSVERSPGSTGGTVSPVLFLCENNLYAMGTRLERAQSQTDLAAKARAYAIPAEAVDGMDVVATEAATARAVEAVRHGEGPAFLEFRTYRFRAHSMFDAELYRDKSEVELWKQRDPIVTFRARLIAQGDATRSAARARASGAGRNRPSRAVCGGRQLGAGRRPAEGRLYAGRLRPTGFRGAA